MTYKLVKENRIAPAFEKLMYGCLMLREFQKFFFQSALENADLIMYLIFAYAAAENTAKVQRRIDSRKQ